MIIKLEETKKYLRHMKKNEPEFFHKYSMNGDLNTEGKKLFESFYEISKFKIVCTGKNSK